MSTLTPLASEFSPKPLKFIAPLRRGKVDAVPHDGEYLGLEQFESWTGRLSGVEPQQHPEGGANTFQEGDVLFGKLRPYLAKAWVADRAGYCTTESLVLVPNSADPRFIRYCLLTPEVISAIDGSTYGSKMPRADWSFIGATRIPCPSRAAQDRIANFLDEQTARIDALIAEKERLAQSLVEFRATKSRDLVTNGLQPGPTKKTHVPWLGKVPARWDVARIKHVARLESGHTPDKKVSEYWENCDIPWVSLNDTAQLLVTDYVQETAVCINELGIQNSSARLLPVGTVFFSRDATIGRCGIAAKPMACSQHFIGWVCGPRLLPEYLLFALRSMGDELERLSMGATLKTIGMDDVKTLAVPLPSVEEQGKIVNAVRKVVAQTLELEWHARNFADRLREYRSSLISAAVTGKCGLDVLRPTA